MLDTSTEDFVINDGERIAQMVLAKHEQCDFIEVIYIIGVTLMVAVMAACSVSYKFNGASIDYTKIGRAHV